MKLIKKWFSYLFGDIITKPSESPNASGFLIKTVWLLRIFIYFFGVYQIFFGIMHLGLLIVISTIFLVAPSIFTRSKILDIPLEMEFFLFIMVFFQFIVGEVNGFYGNIPYYDDIIHFSFPLLISVIGFTMAYSLYFSGKLKVSTGTMIFFVIVVTLGIGAFWEIIEYSSDTYVRPLINNWDRFQGFDKTNAIDDTMTDLINDLLGGIVGAIIASRYVLEAKYNKRMKELFREIVNNFFRSRKENKARKQKS